MATPPPRFRRQRTTPLAGLSSLLAAACCASHRACAERVVTPEEFGAVGDGKANADARINAETRDVIGGGRFPELLAIL